MRSVGDLFDFDNLLPDTPYDLAIQLTSGITLRGADLSWYNEEPEKENSPPLTDDDREQIRAILAVPSFYDRSELLLLKGNGDRAVGLVQRVRDREFHASGENIIWRVEVWFFKFQAGGWEAVAQQFRVLERRRFKDQEAYTNATRSIRWLAELGGIRLKANARETVLKLEWPKTEPQQ